VPAYFHPAVAATDWDRLARARVSAVVLNIASGPGAALETELGTVAAAVRAAGTPVFGYVDTAYGRRPAEAVEAEIHRYRRWYGIDGVFLDQASSSPALLPWYRAVAADARRFGIVVLNHGTYPDERYADLADALVTFEGPWPAYRAVRPPAWALRRPANTFWHLVYATPAHHLGAALRHAASCNAGVVYVTDRRGANPWDGLPGYFEEHVAAIGGEVLA
jgi:hypothetical protein